MTAGPSKPHIDGAMLPHRIVLNARQMPSYAYGQRSPIWWGTLGFAAAEGMGFALAVGANNKQININKRAQQE